MSIEITISGEDPTYVSAVMQWRTYNNCATQRPTFPCDCFASGGIGSVLLEHGQTDDDAHLQGIVTATSDASTFFWQAPLQFAMLPGNMLQLIDPHGQATLFCGDNTDYSLYPPTPCGA